tara:strand:- start:292 stop:486 length:195 start_codon:yes stop_codon:yes gene_type:complete
MMSNIVKVNWYEERLHEFYETDKDNNGYIHGIYLYYGNEPFDYECRWFKTEQEREKYFEGVNDE